MTTQNPKTGLFLIGTLKGFRTYTKPNSQYTNYYVGVCVGEKTDGYGQVSEIVEEVRLKDFQFSTLNTQFSGSIGQAVKVPFRISHRHGTAKNSGKPYSMVEMYLPDDLTMESLQPKAQPKAA